MEDVDISKSAFDSRRFDANAWRERFTIFPDDLQASLEMPSVEKIKERLLKGYLAKLVNTDQ